MAYYHNIITEKSWKELQSLQECVVFVLIGGWAAYLYTKTLKSKDIDIIVNYDQLPSLQKSYDFYKNSRLKKYEAVKGDVQIDVYLPHYSQLGIPAEDLMTQTRTVEGFTVLSLPYLLALKIHTLSQRGRSNKGRKDFIDILSLVQSDGAAVEKTRIIIEKYCLTSSLSLLHEILSEHTDLPELGLNAHRYAVVRKELERLKG